MTEEDTETLLAMMDDRNMTSHTYLEEVAEKMSSQVARYHQLMHHYAQNLTRKSI